MGTFAFGSAKASPGVTTTALLVAARWPTADRIIVECDESGGVLASRLALGALELAAAAPISHDDLEQHVQQWLDVAVLTSPLASKQVHATFRELAGQVTDVCDRRSVDVLVDGGRLAPNGAAWPLLERCSLICLVARPRLEEFTAVSERAQDLRRAGQRVALVLVADGPYEAAEFAQAAEIDLLGTLPFDAGVVADLEAGRVSRRVQRSALWRDAAVLAEQLHSLDLWPASASMP